MKISRQKYSMEELLTFAEYLNDGHSLKETSEHFNINYGTLKSNLTKHGLREPSRKVNNKTSEQNLDYFNKIDTHEKAYFLGLMFADGYIYTNAYKTSKTCGIALQLEDKYILEYFKNELKCTNNISNYKNSAKLAITDNDLYYDLEKLGIKEQKSNLDYDFPNIDEEFINSFILGYFDGDGCITIKASKAIVVSICCNSQYFLSQFQDILLNKYGIETNIREEQGNRKNPIFILYFKGRVNQLKLKNIIYKDSKIYLSRKHEKFMEIPC